jgi:hypothetical protein
MLFSPTRSCTVFQAVYDSTAAIDPNAWVPKQPEDDVPPPSLKNKEREEKSFELLHFSLCREGQKADNKEKKPKVASTLKYAR